MNRQISKLSTCALPAMALPILAGVALVAGWLSGYWTLGAGVALLALCGLAAVARPESFSWIGWDRLQFWNRGSQGETAVVTEAVQERPAARVRREASSAQASLVDEMIDQGRVALLLRPQIAATLAADELERAQQALDDTMAMAPKGPVVLKPRACESWDAERSAQAERMITVDGFFLDRCAVSNRQFLKFVEAGGYEQMSLWDEAIWTAVLTFVDRTGHPGPRFWENGTFAAGQADFPVVGVSWYEASAYARWAGKRLPSDAEWVKTASWPVHADSDRPVQRRYPWGNAMDRKVANLWGSGSDGPIPVDHLLEGASANGVLQLVGNVWEWTSSAFGSWEPPQRKLETDLPLKSLRGGAFDTYFEMQAECQFQSGENPLGRKHNIGFRCALGFCDVFDPSAGDGEPSEVEQALQLEEAVA